MPTEGKHARQIIKKYLPITFKRIDSPFMFFTTGNGKMYRREGDEKS